MRHCFVIQEFYGCNSSSWSCNRVCFISNSCSNDDSNNSNDDDMKRNWITTDTVLELRDCCCVPHCFVTREEVSGCNSSTCSNNRGGFSSSCRSSSSTDDDNDNNTKKKMILHVFKKKPTRFNDKWNHLTLVTVVETTETPGYVHLFCRLSVVSSQKELGFSGFSLPY